MLGYQPFTLKWKNHKRISDIDKFVCRESGQQIFLFNIWNLRQCDNTVHLWNYVTEFVFAKVDDGSGDGHVDVDDYGDCDDDDGCQTQMNSLNSFPDWYCDAIGEKSPALTLYIQHYPPIFFQETRIVFVFVYVFLFVSYTVALS